MDKPDMPTADRRVSSEVETGTVNLQVDLIECPLCAGKGRLSRTYLYDQLGVRDMAKLATHTAKEAVAEITDALWIRYKENLTAQVDAKAALLNKEIENLKSDRASLDARIGALKESMAEKESAAREDQKNKDQASLLKERERLQDQINALTADLNALRLSSSNADEKQQLSVQAATQKLDNRITVLESDKAALQARLQAAEQELAALRAAKQERDRSAKGGIDFEVAAGIELRRLIEDLQDSYDETRNKTGGVIRNSKVGDHVQTLSPDTKGNGKLRVVYECKKEAGYTRADALKELGIARENRQAEVGVFIMAASTVRDDPKAAREFERPFSRFGPDLIVVWDHEDPVTNIVLEVAVSAARALAIRDVGEQAVEADWTSIDRHLNGLVGQLSHFADMKGWCGAIHDRTRDVEERLRIMEDQIRRDCEKLKEQLSALRP